MPYLRCLRLDEAEYVTKEIHKGVCENHLAQKSLAQKALRQGVLLADHAKRLNKPCSKV